MPLNTPEDYERLGEHLGAIEILGMMLVGLEQLTALPAVAAYSTSKKPATGKTQHQIPSLNPRPT